MSDKAVASSPYLAGHRRSEREAQPCEYYPPYSVREGVLPPV